MTIKTLFKLIFSAAGFFVLLTLLMTMNISSSQQDSVRVANERLTSYQLAQEVTLDSDALTRLARTYVTTLNPKYKDEYFRLADKIEGKAPREDGRKIAFRDLLVENAFTAQELALLDKSVGLSIDLIGLEEQAFALVEPMQGLSPEQLSPAQSVQWQQAIGLLFDDNYHHQRDNIFAPVEQFMSMLERRTSSAFVDASANSQSAVVTAITCVVLLVVVLAYALWSLSQRVLAPLDRLKNAAHVVAQGDLKAGGQQSITRQDELGDLSSALSGMMRSLAGLIIEVKDNASAALTTSEHVANDAYSAGDLVESQKQSTQVLAQASQSLSNSADEVSSVCEQASVIVSGANQEITQGSKLMQEARTSVQQITDNLKSADASIAELTQSVTNVSAVVDVINGIAEQTNLLALNAAIEAARAGEQGRGFAVVADEVRSLAQRTQVSTSEILQTVEALQTKAADVSTSVASTNEKFGELADNSVQVDHALVKIGDGFDEIGQATSKVNDAAQAQTRIANDVGTQVSNILKQIEALDTLSEHAETNATDMTKIANSLDSAISRFIV